MLLFVQNLTLLEILEEKKWLKMSKYFMWKLSFSDFFDIFVVWFNSYLHLDHHFFLANSHSAALQMKFKQRPACQCFNTYLFHFLSTCKFFVCFALFTDKITHKTGGCLTARTARKMVAFTTDNFFCTRFHPLQFSKATKT